MDRARWDRLQSIFHQAVEAPAGDRAAFVRAACGHDEALALEVLAMLDEDARGDSLLDDGVAQTTRRLLGDPGIAQVGPYRPLRVLGEGGMGVVWLAERTDLGTTAAIKFLRDAWLSPARRERFAAEQRTLARLDHPGIARLFDAGTLADGTPWIVMEHVEGTAITAHARDHALTIAGRLRLIRQACDAVSHSHRHLVVHRDLKPSNVLVSGDGRVKLLDFGISKALDDAGDATRTVARLMTPAYAAPEQAAGAPVGVASDVYSLGVMLYELIAGRLPADGPAPGSEAPRRPSAIARTASAPAGPRESLSRTAWADLDVLCLTAMQPDPRRRYRTVDALARDIDHYLRGEPLDARPDGWTYTAGKFARRHRLALAGAAAVVALVAGLVAFYTARVTVARNAALVEATRAHRIQELLLSLFTGGDADAGPAGDVRVVTLLQRGVLEAEQLQGEPAARADMLATIGGIYERLGDMTRSEALLESALAQRRTLLGAEHVEVAASLVDLGLLRLAQARLDDAERLVRDGLAMVERLRPAGDAQLAGAVEALGRVLEEKGDYPQAIATLEHAVGLRGETPSRELASALRHLANVQFYAGHYDTAEAIGRRALEMTRQVQGPRHPRVADDLITLGAVQHERGRYDRAAALYREALPITEGWYGADHPATASNLTMLGRTLGYQSHYDEAVALLERALAIQERVFGANHPRVASAVNDLGSIALQRGRLDEAEADFARIAAIYRTVYGESHFLIATAVSNLGSVYSAKRDYRRAEGMYRQAVAMFAATQSPTHPNTAIARLKLGRSLVRQQRYAEAEPSILAGFEVLSKETAPQVSFLRAAREDLTTLYEATGRRELADRYRAASPPGQAPGR